MAKEVLQDIEVKDKPESERVIRGPHHDLESLLLVVIYSVYQNILRMDPKGKRTQDLREEFGKLFGGHDIYQIVSGRAVLMRTIVLKRHADRPTVLLVQFCGQLIYNQTRQSPASDLIIAEGLERLVKAEPAPVPITYSAVREVLDLVATVIQKYQTGNLQ